MKTAFLLAAVAFATISTAHAATTTDVATVVSVKPIYEQVNRPTERCWTETTDNYDQPRQRSGMGAVVGAVAGGILGNQVGQGVGRGLATGAGVIAGAMVGDRLSNGDPAPSHDEVRKCRREDNFVREQRGFEVTYNYGRHQYTTVMNEDPGRTLEVTVSVEPRTRY